MATASYWLAEPHQAIPRRTFGGAPDVAIVGAGISGCSCALTLAEGGLKVRVYDEREIAGGASGRNGGFALRGGAAPYPITAASIGREHARSVWAWTEDELRRLGELAGDAFRRTGSLRLAADAEERTELEEEYEALRDDGFAVEWRDELPAPLAGRYPGAIFHPPDAVLQPARLVRRIAALRGRRRRRVPRARRGSSRWRRRARRRSSSRPTATRAGSSARWKVSSSRRAGRSSRPSRSRSGSSRSRTTAGTVSTTGTRHRTGASSRAAFGTSRSRTSSRRTRSRRSRCNMLSRTSRRVSSAALFASTTGGPGSSGWSSTSCLWWGEFPETTRLWVAGGYSGHGNVLGFACGRLVARAIQGDRDPLLELFEPSRLLG